VEGEKEKRENAVKPNTQPRVKYEATARSCLRHQSAKPRKRAKKDILSAGRKALAKLREVKVLATRASRRDKHNLDS